MPWSPYFYSSPPSCGFVPDGTYVLFIACFTVSASAAAGAAAELAATGVVVLDASPATPAVSLDAPDIATSGVAELLGLVDEAGDGDMDTGGGNDGAGAWAWAKDGTGDARVSADDSGELPSTVLPSAPAAASYLSPCMPHLKVIRVNH